jgi:hypothetical protein
MPAPNWAVGASRKSTKRVLQAYALSASSYGLNQLRYDLRKMKAHGPTATRRQALRLSAYTQRQPSRSPLCPLSPASLWPSSQQPLPSPPDPKHAPQSQLEAAYHKADTAINEIVQLLAA